MAKGGGQLNRIDKNVLQLVHKEDLRHVHKTVIRQVHEIELRLVHKTALRRRHCRIVPFRRYGCAADIISARQRNGFKSGMVLINACIDHRNSYSGAGSGGGGERLVEPYLCVCRLIRVSLTGGRSVPIDDWPK